MQFSAIKNNTHLLLLCLVCLLAVGCEEIVDDPGTLPYEEKLVIRSIVEAGKGMDSILITRTLPPLDAYVEEKAWVHNALVLVRHNGITDTLIDGGRGRYYKPGIVPQPGGVYELDVVWNNKHASAVTRIPQYPTIISTRRNHKTNRWGDQIDVLEARIKPFPGTVYSSTYMYYIPGMPGYTESTYINELYRLSDTTSTGELVIPTESYNYSSGHIDYKISVQAYDEAYYAYFTSYINGNDDDGPFSQNRNVKWNVQGDGIGMFIGIARSQPTDVN